MMKNMETKEQIISRWQKEVKEDIDLAQANKILEEFENEGIIKSSPVDYYSKLAVDQIDTQIDDLERIIILSQDKLEALKEQRAKYE